MKKVLVVNGVNLNMLGVREPEIYGGRTYADLVKYIQAEAKKLGIASTVCQSNYEGKIVEIIHAAKYRFSAIIINAGAYTHTSIAILDALKAVALPTIEVHLTDIQSREDFRKLSYISLYAKKVICGKGFEGYKEALEEVKGTDN